MIGKILTLVCLLFGYIPLTFGLCMTVIGIHNPIHKFKIDEDEFDGSKSINIENTDDKFSFFLLCLIWPLLVLFYWIPIGIYHILKFLVEFVGWSIAKIFKL